ncbi:hypothetical protein AB0J80_30700 [Actinoplanes sp. NPDC049548]|uniref:hypothetical protein n=1 Tax=Actinoplanes sp. NPDC049548 TaxID=3155152 RepID=UPI00343061AC
MPEAALEDLMESCRDYVVRQALLLQRAEAAGLPPALLCAMEAALEQLTAATRHAGERTGSIGQHEDV